MTAPASEAAHVVRSSVPSPSVEQKWNQLLDAKVAAFEQKLGATRNYEPTLVSASPATNYSASALTSLTQGST